MNWKRRKPNSFSIEIWQKSFMDLLLMEQAALTVQDDERPDGPLKESLNRFCINELIKSLLYSALPLLLFCFLSVCLLLYHFGHCLFMLY